jgi:hypothetical protein
VKYQLRYFFEWGGGCLWPGNDAAYHQFGLGPYDVSPCPLPLSVESLTRCKELGSLHDTSLNRDYPPDPGPWQQDQWDRFNALSDQLLADIRDELGSDFEIINRQKEVSE